MHIAFGMKKSTFSNPHGTIAADEDDDEVSSLRFGAISTLRAAASRCAGGGSLGGHGFPSIATITKHDVLIKPT